MKWLGSIAKSLTSPTRSERSKGKITKRRIKKGYTYSWNWSPGPNSVVLSNVDVRLLKELGSVLWLIGDGHDARKLFRQNERTKPKKVGVHCIAACMYWALRAKYPKRAKELLLGQVRKKVPSVNGLTDSTLENIKKKYRKEAFNMLHVQAYSDIYEFKTKDGVTIPHLTRQQFDTLEEYFRSKTKRHDVDK